MCVVVYIWVTREGRFCTEQLSSVLNCLKKIKILTLRASTERDMFSGLFAAVWVCWSCLGHLKCASEIVSFLDTMLLFWAFEMGCRAWKCVILRALWPTYWHIFRRCSAWNCSFLELLCPLFWTFLSFWNGLPPLKLCHFKALWPTFLGRLKCITAIQILSSMLFIRSLLRVLHLRAWYLWILENPFWRFYELLKSDAAPEIVSILEFFGPFKLG